MSSSHHRLGLLGADRYRADRCAAGSARDTHLVVTDLEAAHRELTERGVTVSGIRHKSPIDGWTGGWQTGVDPERRDYASFTEFTDPDGNTWALQEIGFRRPGPDHRGDRTS